MALLLLESGSYLLLENGVDRLLLELETMPGPEMRTTQAVAEILGPGVAAVRTTQAAVESLLGEGIFVFDTQAAVEVLYRPVADARTTQASLEVLYSPSWDAEPEPFGEELATIALVWFELYIPKADSEA